MGHHRDQRDERRGQERHQRNRADGGPAGRLRPGRGVPGPERAQQAGWLAARRSEPDETERQHHGQERGRVGYEGHRVAERRHRGTGQCRPRDTPEVELGRVERDGRQELGRRHQVGQDGLLERPDQRAGRTLHGDQGDERGRAGPARRYQRGQHQCGRRRSQVADDQHRAPGQPVGQRAADRRQQADRQEAARRHQHGPCRLAGVRDDQCAHRDRLHPGADRGDQARGPQQRERPVPERLQRGQAASRTPRLRPSWAPAAGSRGVGRTEFIRGPAHPANLPARTDSPRPAGLPRAASRYGRGRPAGPRLTWGGRFCRTLPVISGAVHRAAGCRGGCPVPRTRTRTDRGLPVSTARACPRRIVPAQRGGHGWRPRNRTCVLGKLTSQFHRTYVLIPACLRSLALPDHGPPPPSPSRCRTWA